MILESTTPVSMTLKRQEYSKKYGFCNPHVAAVCARYEDDLFFNHAGQCSPMLALLRSKIAFKTPFSCGISIKKRLDRKRDWERIEYIKCLFGVDAVRCLDYFVLHEDLRADFNVSCMPHIMFKNGHYECTPSDGRLSTGEESRVLFLEMCCKITLDRFYSHVPYVRQVSHFAANDLAIPCDDLERFPAFLLQMLHSAKEKIYLEIKSLHHIRIDETPCMHTAFQHVWAVYNSNGCVYEMTNCFESFKASVFGENGQWHVTGDSFIEAFYAVDTVNTAKPSLPCFRAMLETSSDVPADVKAKALDLLVRISCVEDEARDQGSLDFLRNKKTSHYVQELRTVLHSVAHHPLCDFFEMHFSCMFNFIEASHVSLDPMDAFKQVKRPFFGGRKSFMFKNKPQADVAIFFYSLIESCGIVGVSPRAYFLDAALRWLYGHDVLTPLVFKNQLMKIT